MTCGKGRRLLVAGAVLALGARALALGGFGTQVTGSIAPLGRLQPGTRAAALASSVLAAVFSGAVWWRRLRNGNFLPTTTRGRP